MTFPGRAPMVWGASSPLSAPIPASFPPAEAHCWPSAPGKGCRLAQLAERWAGEAGGMQMRPYLSVCSCSFLESITGNKGKLWAPRMPQASPGPAESVISATVLISSDTSGFCISKTL